MRLGTERRFCGRLSVGSCGGLSSRQMKFRQKSRRAASARALAAGAAVLTFAGCEALNPPRQLPVPHYRAEADALQDVRRIMVLPFRVEDGVQADTWSVTS